ncbi:hypothetical protein RclHR1_08860008 [Rhizophagus clarus]|uniref:Uncharacterized protein n=1 Tax=Rhizophagus clarus TaxID=94130 RepID=A0A2Z6SD59_9GLOM|nr:hypothetical protein RclHR1_08860008 [Rhizophagus clarus]GES98908.1 hypothetical protein RCL_e27282_RclHR1_08860008 [Rhizophagus clarus]
MCRNLSSHNTCYSICNMSRTMFIFSICRQPKNPTTRQILGNKILKCPVAVKKDPGRAGLADFFWENPDFLNFGRNLHNSGQN